MKEIFLTADLHLGHEKTASVFTKEDGSKLRPFDSAEHQDEVLVQNWNAVVKPTDKVYVLGDVAMNKAGLRPVERLNGDKVLILGNHECLDEDTELLTNRGWLSIKDVSKTDLILSRTSDKKSVWKNIDEIIIKQYNGVVVDFNPPKMSMCMTPEHRIMHDTPEGNSYFLAKEILGGVDFNIVTCAVSNQPEYPVSDDELEFMAWIYTDGQIMKRCASMMIYQSKVDRIEQIKSLLQRLEIEYTLRSKGVKKKGTIVCGKALVKDSKEAFAFSIPAKYGRKYLEMMDGNKKRLSKLIYNLSTRQAQWFIRKIIDGDGAIAKSGESGGIHGSKVFLDDLQALCAMNGVSSSMSMFRSNYVLNFNFTSLVKSYKYLNNIKKDRTLNKSYVGTVWCIMTEESNFMCRRKGFAYFTGNCLPAKDYLKYFRDVRAYHVVDKILFSHIPVHTDSIGRFRANIHGHLHEKVVQLPCGKPDPRYFCVSVEQTGFTPVNYSEVLETVKHNEQYVLDYNLESNFKPKGNHAA